jgi:predicted metal-dependent hydrolase
LDLYVAPGTDTARRQRVVEEWQRARLKELLPDLVTLWSAKLGVAAPTWGVKKMKTKWGSCSTRSQRIWLNLELVKKPAHCLEYVLAHEIAHLLVRDHGERFAALMDRVMPSWQRVRDELNHLPLAPANW